MEGAGANSSLPNVCDNGPSPRRPAIPTGCGIELWASARRCASMLLEPMPRVGWRRVAKECDHRFRADTEFHRVQVEFHRVWRDGATENVLRTERGGCAAGEV